MRIGSIRWIITWLASVEVANDIFLLLIENNFVRKSI